ncbi:hypothetical protein FOA52_005272 [Chlamydomonas sp. UWO 241]|nr:hypothetical protein FOA52_005272 [Chlamydomonas sp. UWO 241]
MNINEIRVLLKEKRDRDETRQPPPQHQQPPPQQQAQERLPLEVRRTRATVPSQEEGRTRAERMANQAGTSAAAACRERRRGDGSGDGSGDDATDLEDMEDDTQDFVAPDNPADARAYAADPEAVRMRAANAFRTASKRGKGDDADLMELARASFYSDFEYNKKNAISSAWVTVFEKSDMGKTIDSSPCILLDMRIFQEHGWCDLCNNCERHVCMLQLSGQAQDMVTGLHTGANPGAPRAPQ